MNMHEDEELYTHRWEEVEGFIEIAKDLNIQTDYEENNVDCME